MAELVALDVEVVTVARDPDPRHSVLRLSLYFRYNGNDDVEDARAKNLQYSVDWCLVRKRDGAQRGQGPEAEAVPQWQGCLMARGRHRGLECCSDATSQSVLPRREKKGKEGKE